MDMDAELKATPPGERPSLAGRTIREVAAACTEVDARLDAIVAAMPPLTPEQKARLRVLLGT